MADCDAVRPGFPGGEEAFTALVLGYLDGVATAEEVARLSAALRAGPACRDLFVHTCRLYGEMCEVFVPIRLAVAEREARRGRERAPAAGRGQEAAGASEAGPASATQAPPDGREPSPGSPAAGPGPEVARDACEDTQMPQFSSEDTVFPEKEGEKGQPPPG